MIQNCVYCNSHQVNVDYIGDDSTYKLEEEQLVVEKTAHGGKIERSSGRQVVKVVEKEKSTKVINVHKVQRYKKCKEYKRT